MAQYYIERYYSRGSSHASTGSSASWRKVLDLQKRSALKTGDGA